MEIIATFALPLLIACFNLLAFLITVLLVILGFYVGCWLIRLLIAHFQKREVLAQLNALKRIRLLSLGVTD